METKYQELVKALIDAASGLVNACDYVDSGCTPSKKARLFRQYVTPNQQATAEALAALAALDTPAK